MPTQPVVLHNLMVRILPYLPLHRNCALPAYQVSQPSAPFQRQRPTQPNQPVALSRRRKTTSGSDGVSPRCCLRRHRTPWTQIQSRSPSVSQKSFFNLKKFVDNSSRESLADLPHRGWMTTMMQSSDEYCRRYPSFSRSKVLWMIGPRVMQRSREG